MRAVVGDDDKLWKSLPGFFTPGTPLYTEEGGDILKKRNVAEAKKLLAESGYKGEPVICVVAQDMAATKSMGDVTAELLKSIGMKVDFVATDWGTTGQRRAMAAADQVEHGMTAGVVEPGAARWLSGRCGQRARTGERGEDVAERRHCSIERAYAGEVRHRLKDGQQVPGKRA